MQNSVHPVPLNQLCGVCYGHQWSFASTLRLPRNWVNGATDVVGAIAINGPEPQLHSKRLELDVSCRCHVCEEPYLVFVQMGVPLFFGGFALVCLGKKPNESNYIPSKRRDWVGDFFVLLRVPIWDLLGWPQPRGIRREPNRNGHRRWRQTREGWGSPTMHQASQLKTKSNGKQTREV